VPKAPAPPTSGQRRPRMKVNPASAGALPLPHEHDEAPEPRPDAGIRPQPEVAQALKDVSGGQVDTDNYTRARDVARNAGKRR